MVLSWLGSTEPLALASIASALHPPVKSQICVVNEVMKRKKIPVCNGQLQMIPLGALSSDVMKMCSMLSFCTIIGTRSDNAKTGLTDGERNPELFLKCTFMVILSFGRKIPRRMYFCL